MKTVNIREAKTQLSKLVDEAYRGEPSLSRKQVNPWQK
jgi:antitoxin (DNA-binding transcriptional repressor) of toxin-antitoxin stability system